MLMPLPLPPMQDKTTDFVERWIAQHIQQAASLGKPMLLEE